MTNQLDDIHDLSRKNWDSMATSDPLDAILTGLHTDETEISDFYESGEIRIEQTLNLVQSHGINLSHDRALDFGCGAGRLTSALATRFDQVWGVDISPQMIEIATQSVAYENCNFESLKEPGLGLFDSDYFDFVISLLVVQHIDPSAALLYVGELFRILKPGGVLVLQIPHAPDWTPKGIRFRLVRSLPDSIRRALRKASNRPETMLMYGMKESRLLNIAAENGATCASVERTLTNGWQDRQYIFKRFS